MILSKRRPKGPKCVRTPIARAHRLNVGSALGLGLAPLVLTGCAVLPSASAPGAAIPSAAAAVAAIDAQLTAAGFVASDLNSQGNRFGTFDGTAFDVVGAQATGYVRGAYSVMVGVGTDDKGNTDAVYFIDKASS
ncbi:MULTISPECIES: hypothetical protein [Subtercola]|uniref:Uncharacterized protein n=1 Tax=Subtercola vilae TaxID=2056433 RepID=A0A4T2C439_9MICO|nr:MULTISPECIES: hypothetical protein [Subtercola]MEA9986040.1 hypothetical protein [Subtercola sp. RTI3]TIH36938.1 hypothetical protein D4765_09415 [Subtercola vilae]